MALIRIPIRVIKECCALISVPWTTRRQSTVINQGWWTSHNDSQTKADGGEVARKITTTELRLTKTSVGLSKYAEEYFAIMWMTLENASYRICKALIAEWWTVTGSLTWDVKMFHLLRDVFLKRSSPLLSKTRG